MKVLKKLFWCFAVIAALFFVSCEMVTGDDEDSENDDTYIEADSDEQDSDEDDPTVDNTPPAEIENVGDGGYINFTKTNFDLGYNEKVILKTLIIVKPEDEARIRFVVDYEGKGQTIDGKPVFAPANPNSWNDAYYLDGTGETDDKGRKLTLTLYVDGVDTGKTCTVTIADSGVGTMSGSGGSSSGGSGSGSGSGSSGSGSGSGNSGTVLPPKTTPNDKPLVGIFSLDDRNGESGNWHVFIFYEDGSFRYSACTGHDGAYQKAHGGYIYGKEKQVAGTYSVPSYSESESRQINFNVTQRTLERAVSPQMVAWEDWNGDKGFYLTYTREKIQTKRIFMRDAVLEKKYTDWLR